MKTSEMNNTQIRTCAERCDVPHSGKLMEGGVLVIASVRGTVWKREAKAKGRVKIGSHNFVYFPKSGTLCREDFCGWCNSHWHECLTVDGAEKLPETADKVEMTVKGELPMWKDIRKMALQCREITGMMHESSWNSLAEMKEAIADHMDELRRDEKNNQRYLITNIQTCLLNIVYGYRKGEYKNVVSYFKQLGALGLSGAMWVQEHHAKDVQ